MRAKEDLSPYIYEDYEGEFNLLNHQRNLICDALDRTKGHIGNSAKLIGMSSRNFHRQLKRHELESFVEEIKKENKN